MHQEQFETLYAPMWDRLDRLLSGLENSASNKKKHPRPRLTTLPPFPVIIKPSAITTPSPKAAITAPRW